MPNLDTTSRSTRLAGRLRYAVIVLLITVAAFAVLELTVTLVWPQASTLASLDGMPVSLSDSLLIHRYRPNTRITHGGPEFNVEYEINADGLRDAVHHDVPKPPSRTRILLLGDSFTFGQGMAYDSIWPTVFERELLSHGYDVDVVKAGVQGYSTREEVLLLEQLHSRFDPDIVVLAFLPNDLYANAPIATDPDTSAVAANTGSRGRMRSGLQSILLLQRALATIDRLYIQLYLLTPWTEYYQVPPTPTFLQKVEVTTQLLQQAHEFCRANGSTFVLLSVPQQFQVLAEAHEYRNPQIDVHLIDRTIAEFAHTEGIPWISTIEEFAETYRSSGKDLFFRVDGHLNAKGNRVLADKLRESFLGRFADDREHPGSVQPILQRATSVHVTPRRSIMELPKTNRLPWNQGSR